MRSVMAGLVCGALLLGAGPARAVNGGAEAGYALGAFGANLFYIPAKLMLAGAGMVAGGVTGFLTGGSERAAYAIWVPTVSGTFVLKPSHMDGSKPVEFFGSDYADTPATAPSSLTYRAQYGR